MVVTLFMLMIFFCNYMYFIDFLNIRYSLGILC